MPDDAYNGTGAGAAIVYRRPDGASCWEYEARLVAADGQRFDQFGWSVAVDGDLIAVGAKYRDGDTPNTGAAYLFRRRAPGTWEQIARLVAPDAHRDDEFGWSVALDGDLIAVGAHRDDDAGRDSGAVHLFTRTNRGWRHLTKVSPATERPFRRFGDAVALDGRTLAVGSRFDDSPTKTTGAVYIYEAPADHSTHWNQLTRLTPSPAHSGDWFGAPLALDDGRLYVGARYDDEAARDAGAVYVYERADAAKPWQQLTKILPTDAQTDRHFGAWLAVDGPALVIGASGH